jgi:tricorn protease
MFIRTLSILPLILALSNSAAAIEASLPRHPAPSPDGSQVAFSWQGDLWLVSASGGEARRLTAHPATERYPVWSRDGSMLAFASDRHGSLDVFVMRTDGAEAPRRLTFASVTDTPCDFTPDGSSVLFSSRRAEGVSRTPQLFTVPVQGGTPSLVQDAFGRSAAYSPDGSSLTFVRGGSRWSRRGYRGSGNFELWLRTGDSEYRQLTTFDGDDDFPSWVGPQSLVFLSARAGRKNLFRMGITPEDPVQLTDHEGSAVRFPRASADGSVVAYEFEDAIWTVSTDGGEPARLTINVPADLVVNPVELRVESEGASDLAINDDGTLAAFVVHGDVFVSEITSKEDQEIAGPMTVRVTDTPEREQEPAWSPDGNTLVFVSARDGGRDLYTARLADGATSWTESFDFEITRITSSAEGAIDPRWSPDGRRIAFTHGKGDIVVIDATGGAETVLLEHWETPDYRWSPDGGWIAYSVEDMNANAEVWIVSADGGTPYNVSRHPDYDRNPRWSPDGRRLVWLTRRHADSQDVWGVWLTAADHERTPAEWLKLWKNEDPDDEDEEKSEDDTETGGKFSLPPVSIEFDRLWERAQSITDLKGDEGSPLVSPDGKTIVFTAEHEGERDLYSVRYDGDKLERLTTGGQQPTSVQFQPSDETIFYLDKGGVIKRVGIDGESGDPVPFAARHEVDMRLERRVVFDEAWSVLDIWFYDPDFHGVDWSSKREIYRPWALAASTEADFADVMNLMFGELNASHMAYRPRTASNREETGFVGAFFDPAAEGPGLLIREVLPDSPAARHDVSLEVGDRILSVKGRALEDTTNVYELFADTVEQRVPLRVAGADGNERTVTIIPISAREQAQLRYEEWVRERRRLVDEWSSGRLGYIHIQAMNMASFEEFERGLFASADGKEGVVIDVRFNGGGSTTDYLMAVLMVQRHAYTVPRGSDPDRRAYPTAERLPLMAWTRPAVTLCNEQSYSNAEIFSYAFQTLGRGTLVGRPTFGAVISTGGTRMMNGAWVRLPRRGWYVAGTGVNMENNGAVPDVEVVQPPDQDRSAILDDQLQRAVEVLLDEIPSDPRRGAW